jgi:hypothetical protein
MSKVQEFAYSYAMKNEGIRAERRVWAEHCRTGSSTQAALAGIRMRKLEDEAANIFRQMDELIHPTV